LKQLTKNREAIAAALFRDKEMFLQQLKRIAAQLPRAGEMERAIPQRGGGE
jgi:hypothetical protein